MPNPTGQKSHADLLEGDKLYIQRARKALPILVRQARAGKTITYSDLAEEMEMPNPRNLNYVLGAIGNALLELAKREKTDPIPVINCLVVNQSSGLPGEGINWFIPKETFDKQSKNQQRETLKVLLAGIYTYQDWFWVLDELGLEPTKNKAKVAVKPDPNKGGYGGGESPEHKRFKNYMAKHPELLGLKDSLKGKVEHVLPSADIVDVLFIDGEERIGVEVKSKISDVADIHRGLFQCVKYKAVIEAEQIANDELPNCRVVLALEKSLPPELLSLKNQLGIEVFELKRK